MKKIDIYKNEIAPLLEKAMKICDEHDIPLVSAAQLDEDRDVSFEVGHVSYEFVMALPDDLTNLSHRFQGAIKLLGHPQPRDKSAMN